MRNKVIIYLLTLAFVFTSAANIFALANDFYDVNINELEDSNPIIDEEPDTPDPEPVEDRMLEMEEYVSTEAEENALDNEELEIAEEEVLDGVQRSGDKTFTVTKRSLGSTEEGELVGEYDTLYDAFGACSQNDMLNEYVITVNKDYDIPADESVWSRQDVNILLKSAQGKTCTLKRLGTRLIFYVAKNCNTRVENIILDGNNDGELTFVSENGELTLGKGTVVQNFIDIPLYDGPAIYLTNKATLNIEDGAIIQNNKGKKNGGAIEANDETTINISGGTFTGNSCEKFGGAVATWGKLNINGGTFEKNGAPYGGAIAVFKKSTANIENATFTENSSKQGGAIISWNELRVKSSNFEGNKATWGGAIFSSKKLTLSESTFNKNKVSSAGGAIYASQGVELNNVSFDENIANKQGGAIYINKGNSTLTDCNFTKNASQAIFINHDNKGTTKILKTSFTENFSNSFGGGIYLGKNSKLEVSESTFTKNQAAFGASIASAGTGEVDSNLTNIKVDSSTFTENEALMGGGIFTAFPTEITNSTFTKNKALIHPQDDQTNPHLSGVGGAIEVMDNKTVIKDSTFEGNTAGGSGGAIGINGVTRDDDGKITGIKQNIKVEISDNTKFIKNTCGVGQGGAIFTIPYLYDIGDQKSDVAEDTLKENAYKNISTDGTTLFKGNEAGTRLFNPPENFADFTELKFSDESDTPYNKYMNKSLLNNYDINYKSGYLIIYDANGGKFADGDKIKITDHSFNDQIKIMEAPTRAGYKFLYWKGSKYNPGDSYTVKDNHTFVAQWEAEEPEPQPYDPGYFYYETEKAKPVERDLDVYRWYMEGNENNEFMPKKGITRAEMAQIFARALAYDGYKTYGDYNPYPDVDPNKWYYQAVVTTTEAGVFKGTDMGTFEPQREITQAELIATISRFQKLINKEGNAFEMKFDHWARPEVQAAYEEKWLELYKDGRANFSADAVITREEVATILNKAFGRPIDEKYIKDMQANIKDIEKTLKTFKDIDKDMWSYYEILTAANTYAVEYKDKERTDYEWYNHAIEDDGPSMPVEKVRWYKGLLNNDKYIDHLYQIKFQREMRRY